jgi:ribosomal protein S18 acetylase RimI-like enzyme
VTATEIERPAPRVAESLATLWVELARDQRAHGSHLLAGVNRKRVRDTLARYAATDRLLVARSRPTATGGDGDGDSGILGFVMFRKRAGEYAVDCERGLVENIYVVPDSRGQGIGSDLLTAAEQQLREGGVDAISLEAIATNQAARRFYRSHGYEPHRVEFEKSVDDER